MTARQIELVQQSWQLVAAEDVQVTGKLFYNYLFETVPEVRPMFRRSSIQEQSGKLMAMLNYSIRNLDNLGEIGEGIKKLGRQHVQYGVQDEHYTLVGRALLWTLQKVLANSWNKELEQAWITCYTTLAEIMMKAAKANDLMQKAAVH
ncbi:MAG: globin family protein [Chitinophagaceae bacterium]